MSHGRTRDMYTDTYVPLSLNHHLPLTLHVDYPVEHEVKCQTTSEVRQNTSSGIDIGRSDVGITSFSFLKLEGKRVVIYTSKPLQCSSLA